MPKEHTVQRLVVPGVGTYDFEKDYKVSVQKEYTVFSDSKQQVKVRGTNWTFCDVELKGSKADTGDKVEG